MHILVLEKLENCIQHKESRIMLSFNNHKMSFTNNEIEILLLFLKPCALSAP